MTFVIPSLNAQSIIFQNIVDTINLTINCIANAVMTVNTSANGSVTTGNAWVNGIFGAVTGSFNTLGGGNVQSSATLQFVTNGYFGNSTVNVSFGTGTINIGSLQINSVGIVIGTAILNSTARFLGNTTANQFSNSIFFSLANGSTNTQMTPGGFFLNGVQVGGMVVVNNGTTFSQSKLNFIANGTASLNISSDAADGWVNVVITATGGAATPAGANTDVQFNDSGITNGSLAFVFNKTTNTVTLSNTLLVGANVVVNTSQIFIGNTTVNANYTSALITLANSTNTATMSPTQFAVGISIVNTTTITVGANVTVNSSVIEVGNSTVNVTVNSSLISVGANVTVGPIQFFVGTATVNAIHNASTFAVSNSTLITQLAVTGLTVGQNTTVNSSSIVLGNTTISMFANSLLVQVANATQTANLSVAGLVVGTTIVNATAVSAALYLGAGLMAAPNSYWNNTAGLLMTTDKMVNAATWQTITDNTTPAWNQSNGINFEWILGGNRVLPNFTGTMFPGRAGTLWIKQDATGGRTLSFGNQFVFSTNTAPSINTTAAISSFLSYLVLNSSNVLITMPAVGVPV